MKIKASDLRIKIETRNLKKFVTEKEVLTQLEISLLSNPIVTRTNTDQYHSSLIQSNVWIGRRTLESRNVNVFLVNCELPSRDIYFIFFYY